MRYMINRTIEGGFTNNWRSNEEEEEEEPSDKRKTLIGRKIVLEEELENNTRQRHVPRL